MTGMVQSVSGDRLAEYIQQVAHQPLPTRARSSSHKVSRDSRYHFIVKRVLHHHRGSLKSGEA